jgi:Mg2+-importing ATPase
LRDELPFDFERRRESVVVDDGGRQWLLTKGAPEAMLPICTFLSLGGESVPMNETHHRDIDSQYQRLSADGFRVVTVARREYPADHAQPNDEQAMTFLGFVALLDPPKLGVRQTIDALEKMGIAIKILTGDGLALTEKICRDIDCPNKGSMTGEELERLTTPEEWKTAVESHTIFARIDPEQKEQIIRTLQAAKHVVGFLGDGINDAPALKQADVGISVNNAVDVARETADIILLEHSLEAIRNGIREGRRTFHHTMTYIKMSLSSNFGNMFSMTAASAFLPFLPMLPTQVLFNNFLYDASQLSLSTDAVDDQDITRQTAWNFQGLRKFMIIFGLISSVFDILTFYVLYTVTKSNPAIFQTGWFMQSIATQILVLYVLRTRRIPFLQSRPSLALFANTMLMLAIAWILPFIQLGKYFSFTAIPLHLGLMLVGIVLGYLTVVGLAQRLLRKQLHYV